MKNILAAVVVLLTASVVCFAGYGPGKTDLSGVYASTGALKADIDTLATSVGVSTAGIRLDLTAVGISTAGLRTDVTSVGVSTAGLQTSIDAVGVATGTLAVNVGVSTAEIRTDLVSVGVSTAEIRTNIDALITQYVGGVQISTPAACLGCPQFLMPPREYAITITTMVAINRDGTSTTLQVEQRTNPNESGTNVWTGAVTVSSTGITGGTFDDATVPAGSWLIPIFSAESGGVKSCWIYYRFTKD
jgi:hypothetical protein